MRFPVVFSIAFHGALFVGILKLPARALVHRMQPVEVEIQHAPAELPPPPVAVPPVPLPEKIAMRDTRPNPADLDRRPPEELARPSQIEPPSAHSESPPPSSAPPPPVDLRLHALPSGTGSFVAPPAPSGTGTGIAGGFFNSAKRGHPSAGDPLTGHIIEVPEDKYPLQNNGPEGFVYKGKQFTAHIALDGQVDFNDKKITDFKGLSGGFDLTDAIMRSKGDDPNRVEKKKFMEATADLRAKLSAEGRAADRARSLEQLERHLSGIWTSGRAPEERRRLLFFVWKETFGGDEEQKASALEARRIIERFIRERLPSGSSEGYSEIELGNLNRGLHESFHPYR